MSLTLSLMLILVTAYLFQNNKIVEAADNFVLLENRNPGYWNNLTQGSSIKTPIIFAQEIDGFSGVSADEILKCNMISELYTGELSGLQISAGSGKMNIQGNAQSDVWIGVTENPIYLDEGTYFISTGATIPSNKVSIYFEGWKGDANSEIVYPTVNHFFYLTEAEYDYCKWVVKVYKGTCIKESLQPIIYKISEKNLLPAITERDAGYAWSGIEDEITDRDWNVFYNSLHDNSNKGVFFTNGTYRILKNEQWVEGKLDNCGRY